MFFSAFFQNTCAKMMFFIKTSGKRAFLFCTKSVIKPRNMHVCAYIYIIFHQILHQFPWSSILIDPDRSKIDQNGQNWPKALPDLSRSGLGSIALRPIVWLRSINDPKASRHKILDFDQKSSIFVDFWRFEKHCFYDLKYPRSRSFNKEDLSPRQDF